MNNKEELLEAVDYYNLFTPKYRIVLRTLINLAINNKVIITIKELSKLSGASRIIVYEATRLLEEKQMLEIAKRPHSRLSEFLLKYEYLKKIVEYHKIYMKVKKDLATKKKIARRKKKLKEARVISIQ